MNRERIKHFVDEVIRFVATFTFKLNPKFQQPHLRPGSETFMSASEHALRRTRRLDEEKVPSLSDLSLQAIFKGYGRPKLWGPLKALVEIQRKWRVLRHRAYWQAAYFIQQAAMYLEHGFPVPLVMSGQFSMAHIRRYHRIKLALRTSQARVQAQAITQSV
jgi:hypothetical protein